jgi:hypothetical protein
MPTTKPVRKPRASHPLRNLREELGSGGKRLSTYKLSGLVGIPAATLRSIETGRIAFNEDLQQRLRWRGLNWDQKSKHWSFTYNPELALTVDLITSFNRLSRGDDLYQDLEARSLCIQLVTLLDTVPASSYNALVSNLRDTLNRFRVEYKAVGGEEVFAETTPKFTLIPTRSGAQVLDKEFIWRNPPDPHRILDLSALQKSHIRVEEQAQNESFGIVKKTAA